MPGMFRFSQSPSQMKCPEDPGGGTHHLIPRRREGASVLTCIYCKQTEKEIRESHA